MFFNHHIANANYINFVILLCCSCPRRKMVVYMADLNHKYAYPKYFLLRNILWKSDVFEWNIADPTFIEV